MINYYRNQKVIKRWMKKLNTILIYHKSGLYNLIEDDYILNRLIEVIEEYDDIIFGVDNNE